jgi:hypothetical protein
MDSEFHHVDWDDEVLCPAESDWSLLHIVTDGLWIDRGALTRGLLREARDSPRIAQLHETLQEEFYEVANRFRASAVRAAAQGEFADFIACLSGETEFWTQVRAAVEDWSEQDRGGGWSNAPAAMWLNGKVNRVDHRSFVAKKDLVAGYDGEAADIDAMTTHERRKCASNCYVPHSVAGLLDLGEWGMTFPAAFAVLPRRDLVDFAVLPRDGAFRCALRRLGLESKRLADAVQLQSVMHCASSHHPCSRAKFLMLIVARLLCLHSHALTKLPRY